MSMKKLPKTGKLYPYNSTRANDRVRRNVRAERVPTEQLFEGCLHITTDWRAIVSCCTIAV